MATIAVDFDGVIHDYKRGWQDGSVYGELVPGALTALLSLMSQHAVFVLTSRNPRQAARWIERQTGYAIECTTRVPRRGFWDARGYVLVTNRKLPAAAYIDDRAIRFADWDQALSELCGEGPKRVALSGLDAVHAAVRAARGGDAPRQARGFA